MPQTLRQAIRVCRAGVRDDLSLTIEEQDRHLQKSGDAGQQVADILLAGQKTQKMVLHGHGTTQPVHVAGCEGVVDVRDDRAQWRTVGNLQQRYAQRTCPLD